MFVIIYYISIINLTKHVSNKTQTSTKVFKYTIFKIIATVAVSILRRLIYSRKNGIEIKVSFVLYYLIFVICFYGYMRSVYFLMKRMKIFSLVVIKLYNQNLIVIIISGFKESLKDSFTSPKKRETNKPNGRKIRETVKLCTVKNCRVKIPPRRYLSFSLTALLMQGYANETRKQP